MTIARLHQHFTRTLLTLSLTSLIACGGGGGDNSPAPDTTPNAYSYTATTNAELSAVVTSAPVTIAGIDVATPVSITGGEYSINGGAFTAVAGTVTSGQTITIRLTAPAANSTSASAQLTVGGVTGTFTVTTKADTTPNAFAFTAQTNAELSAVVTSAPVTIAGIDAATPVSITGGEYSINGGAFTSTAGTVTSGQTITIRLTAPAANSTSASAQLTVGGVTGTFTVTTKADTTPNAFAFTAQANALLNTEYTSNVVTITGIDAATPISISGGTYSINGGAFTAAAGTVSVHNTIAVKATSGRGNSVTQHTVVTIGGVSATYSITTIPDTTPPVAEFKFPTPYTMSEANSVKVRGTATDDNTITNVKVVVRSFNLNTPSTTLSTTEIDATPKAETNGVKDFSSWTADIPLTLLAENEIKVIATDDRNNTIELSNAKKVVVRQADVSSAFPDGVNQLEQFERMEFSALDSDRNRILISHDRKIIAVDISTGKRTIFSEHQNVCNNILRGLTIDNQNSRLYGVCEQEVLLEFNLLDGTLVGEYEISLNPARNYFFGLSLDRFNGRNRLVLVEQAFESRIMSFGLDSKEFDVISPHDESLPIINPFGGIALDDDSYWVTSGGQSSDAAQHKIIKINAITGKREVFADNSTGSGELLSALLADGETAFLSAIVKDTQNNRFIIMESISSKLIGVDIDTGARTLFKDVSYNSTDNQVISFDMDLDETNGLLLVLDQLRRSVVMVDLETREKIIISKSKNDF